MCQGRPSLGDEGTLCIQVRDEVLDVCQEARRALDTVLDLYQMLHFCLDVQDRLFQLVEHKRGDIADYIVDILVALPTVSVSRS